MLLGKCLTICTATLTLMGQLGMHLQPKHQGGKGEKEVLYGRVSWVSLRYGTCGGTCFLGPLSDGHELRKSFGANNFAPKAWPSAGQ